MRRSLTVSMIEGSTDLNCLWDGLPREIANELYPGDSPANNAAYLQLSVDLEHLTYRDAYIPNEIAPDQFEDFLVSRAVKTAIRSMEAAA